MCDQISGTTCSPGYLGVPPSCSCFQDNTQYFGNNLIFGNNNLKPSQSACQKSCRDHPECKFWTWRRRRTSLGQCYLKDGRDSVTPKKGYISGSKYCSLTEDKGDYTELYPCMI